MNKCLLNSNSIGLGALIVSAGVMLMPRTEAEPLRWEDNRYAVTVDAQAGRFSVMHTPSDREVLASGRLSGANGMASRVKVADPRLGEGDGVEIVYPNGNRETVALFKGLPFVTFRSTFHNGGRDPLVLNHVPTVSADVLPGTPLQGLRTLGSGGLLAPERNPGSYVFLAVVTPATRAGVVSGWLTHDRGSGVVFSPVKDGTVGLQAQLDYGRLRIPPGAAAGGELFAIGYFDDARLGLEAYADAVARANAIRLLPGKPGFCTWYLDQHRGNGACDERHVPELAAYAAEHLRDYGFSNVIIDDGWQLGKGGNGPRKYFADHNPKGPFPGGMKSVSGKIAGVGLSPGIWFMPFAGTHDDPYFKDHQDWFARNLKGDPYDVEWGGTCLDMTNPAARDYLCGIVKTLARDGGYKLFKLDGLWTGTATTPNPGQVGYKEDGMGDAVFFNPDKTNIEALRDGLKLVRETAGSDVFLLGCCIRQHMRSFGGAIGLVDGMRVSPDTVGTINPNEPSRLWFLNGRVWWNDPDCVYVRAIHDIEKARLNATFPAIAGTFFYCADWLPDLPPQRLDILRRCMPAHNLASRPVDIFDIEPAQVWHLADTRDAPQRRDVVTLFNWSKAPAKVWSPVGRIGLPVADEYVGFDFWNNKFVPPFRGEVAAELPRESCRVLSIRPATEHPQLISTSRHVTQGMMDVAGERWDPAGTTLSATSTLVANDPYELRIVVPVGGKSWKAKGIAISPDDTVAGVTAGLTQDGPRIRVALASPTGREVKWSVRFEQAAVDAGELRQVGRIKAEVEYRQITLSWDDTGADAYRVVRSDGKRFVTPAPLYVERDIKHGAKYRYSVEALYWGRAAPAGTVEVTAMAGLKPPETVPPTIAIADLKPLSFSGGKGKLKTRSNIEGGPFRIGGKKYAKGLGVPVNSTTVYAVPAGAVRFVAVVGADDASSDINLSKNGCYSMVFEVYGDTKELGGKPELLEKSPVLSYETIQRWAFNIALDPRCRELRLVVTDAGDGTNSDVADWVNIGFVGAGQIRETGEGR